MPFWAAKKLDEVTQSGYDMSFKNLEKCLSSLSGYMISQKDLNMVTS